MSQSALPQVQETQSAREVPGWLVLKIDNLNLAIPQKEASAVELVTALDVAIDGEPEAGWLTQNNEMWPAYSVDSRLELQTETPPIRRFCVMFHGGDRYIGLLCDQVRMLQSDGDLTLDEMPACLAEEQSPLQWIALLEDQVVAAAKSGGLVEYLIRLEAQYGAE